MLREGPGTIGVDIFCRNDVDNDKNYDLFKEWVFNIHLDNLHNKKILGKRDDKEEAYQGKR